MCGTNEQEPSRGVVGGIGYCPAGSAALLAPLQPEEVHAASVVCLPENEGIEYDPAFEVSLADDKLDDAIEMLALIHKRSIARDGLELICPQTLYQLL
jgi:hypothetical protein